MHPLQKQFHDGIIEKQLFQENEKVLLAVSGGVDSMVMAHLFLSSKIAFGIAHCNFGLRNEESDKDEQLVRSWSEEHKIKCHVKQFDLKGSIQLAARNARYEWFEQLMIADNYAVVATAHHLNDSLETALFNITRGTGIKGLSGISPKSNKVIRPILFATKDQLISYANDQHIVWREDASNTKVNYGRNLIRNEVIPMLKKLNPSLDETFKNTVERLELTNRLLEQRIAETKNSSLQKERGLWKLDVSWINKETDLLILSEIISGFGFNYVIAKEVFLALDKPGKVFSSEHFELSIDRSIIYIKENQSGDKEEITITGEGVFSIGESVLKLSMVDKKDVSFGTNKNISFFEAQKITFPLQVRPWKEGDRFKPLGMSGTKKISDYLIDCKVPLALKEDIHVIASNDSIIWLVGHQISDDFKITDQSHSVIRIEWT